MTAVGEKTGPPNCCFQEAVLEGVWHFNFCTATLNQFIKPHGVFSLYNQWAGNLWVKWYKEWSLLFLKIFQAL